MTYINYFILSFLIVMSLYAFISIFALLNTLRYLKTNQMDELQKQAIYESFAFTFLIIVSIHFIQLFSKPLGIDLTHLISPGGFNGTLFGIEGNLHIDSFIFDCLILSFIYFLRKIKYGLLSSREVKKRILIPFILTTLLFIVFSFK